MWQHLSIVEIHLRCTLLDAGKQCHKGNIGVLFGNQLAKHPALKKSNNKVKQDKGIHIGSRKVLNHAPLHEMMMLFYYFRHYII